MFTIKFENNNNYKMNEKKFNEIVKWTVDEIGEFDAIYYIEAEKEYWFDVFAENVAEITNYEWDSYEIENKKELLEKISEIVHW